MIYSKSDLKYYLSEDLRRNNNKKPLFKDWILHNEKWYIYHYIRHLRYVEYHINTNKKGLLFLYHWFIYKRLCFKLKYNIKPNNVGPGFKIYHIGGYVGVKPLCRIGKNCTLQQNVIIGNKTEHPKDDEWTIIGDNCYIGVGVRILGSVKIGNNVTIGANAVVTKDIPDNSIVGGIPAKVIRMKNI